MRKPIFLVIGLIALVYVGVAVTSPLKDSIGRSRPRLAAAFSPPWFNFHADYSTGQVLEFRIGMNREQFGEVVQGYAGPGSVLTACGGGITTVQMVPLGNQPEALAMLQRDVVCLWYEPNRLSLIFKFTEDRLTRIEVTVVNVELI